MKGYEELEIAVDVEKCSQARRMDWSRVPKDEREPLVKRMIERETISLTEYYAKEKPEWAIDEIRQVVSRELDKLWANAVKRASSPLT